MPLEPIAIVGIGCRFPGADNPEAFWQLLRNGIDAVTEVPASRWNANNYYHRDPAKPDKANTRWGGFLKSIDRFDPKFFGIAPREAITMDPQQRLILEVAWEALEDAGLIPEQLRGTQTGVFIGIGTHDYSILLWQEPINEPYATTGTGNCVAANRISYTFDFKGPSLAIDTACSSSLVAVHLACQSLWQGETNMALAGGVNILLLPTITVGFSKGGFLSSAGRCKSFDASADGYVRSEGAGIVVLKPLAQAQVDGDPIYAVIRGSAVNQDGSSNGLAAPNPEAQKAVLREAYRQAGVSPNQIQYIEAHGTGTQRGDVAEMQALGTVLAEGMTPGFCTVGSVKTNIGHAETAAGIAGLIKVALALKHQQIPPSLHFHQPNPAINFEQLPLRVQTSLTPWPNGTPARAGVNSFGFGGTNAHVVLEAVSHSFPGLKSRLASSPGWNIRESVGLGLRVTAFRGQKQVKASQPERSWQLLTLSAKDDRALRELAQRYQTFLSDRSESLADVCFTANTKRTQFNHRLCALAESPEQLQQQLGAFVLGRQSIGLVQGQITAQAPQVAFLLTGQGAQYVGMGKQLYETQPTFRAALDRCDEILRPYLDQSLLSVLYPDLTSPSTQRLAGKSSGFEQAQLLNETAYTQPALFALEYALAQLWLSWGVVPSAVMGHSVGEYVAACLAGVFSLEDGLKLVAARGRLMQQLPQAGAMVAVLAAEARVHSALAPYEQVAIAAFNGPQSIVISGQREAIAAITAQLEAEGIKATPLQVSHAFHSPLMEPMLAQFEQIAREVVYSPPSLKLIANVTGELATADIATPQYWCRHIREPVQFAASMATLRQAGYKTFVEVGPKPLLLGMGRSLEAEGNPCQWLPSLRPGQSDWHTLLQSLGELYVRGVPIDWLSFERDYSRHSVHLPTYPFQRQQYWWRGAERSSQHPCSSANFHPLLGQRLQLAGTQEIRFQSQISQACPTYLSDHRIGNEAILPATAFLEMALAAGAKVLKASRLQIEQFTIEQPLLLSEGEQKTVQLLLVPQNWGYTFQIYSISTEEVENEAAFTLHATGKVGVADKEDSASLDLTERLADTSPISATQHYQQLREQGLHYGASFQAIQQLWQGQGQALGKIQLPETLSEEDYQVHPVLLDACLQTIAAAIEDNQLGTYLPVGLERLRLYKRPGSRVWTQVQLRDRAANGASSKQLKVDLLIGDEAGTIVAEIEGVSLQFVTLQSLQQRFIPKENLEDWLYEVAWKQKPNLKNQNSKIHHWLILADEQGIGEKLASQLEEQGDRIILVFPGQYDKTTAQRYSINPSQPEDFQQLLKEIDWSADWGVVHLWSLNKLPGEITLFSLQAAQTSGCESIFHLVQSLSQTQPSQLPKLWLVTKGAQAVNTNFLQVQQAPVWGLGRVIGLEYPDLHCTCLDLDPSSETAEIPALLEALSFPDPESQIAYRQGERYVARLVKSMSYPTIKGQQQNARADCGRQSSASPAFSRRATLSRMSHPGNSGRRGTDDIQLKISRFGELDNLFLAPAQWHPPGIGEVEIQVCAAGVNFRDVLKALGMLSKYLPMGADADNSFGGECAGRIVAVGEGVKELQVGDEVIATQALGSLASFVTVKAQLVAPKPKTLSFTEAATLSSAFLTAYYGLHYWAKIKPGDRVLIHAAAGGVGQAAVQLAQRVGAEVWATASPGKWDFLQSMGVKHVMNSRTLDFADEVMQLTDGEGVDIILNSLNGEFIPKNLEILAAEGQFIEIGKIGIWEESQIKQKRADVSYFSFDLLELAKQQPSLIASLLAELMQMFRQEKLKPLPHKVFPIEEAAIAFRYMAQAKHIGKVVIALPETVPQQPTVRSDSSYLITGGLGALGLQVAQWLAKQGANHLVLVGRREASPTAQAAIAQMKQAGVQVIDVPADISNPDEVEQIIAPYREQTFPPLKGIVQAAGVLDDGVLSSLSWERFRPVMAPKVAGTWNLHIATLDLPLDFFVCFSSIASLLGSSGQGNYAAANAFMDAFVHYRRELGLPGLSINWGPWSIGMAAGSSVQERLRLQGLLAISPQQGLQLLEGLLEQRVPQIAVLPVDWSVFYQPLPERVRGFFEDLIPSAPELQQRSQLLEQIETAGDRKTLLHEHVRSQLAKVLGFSSSELVDPQTNFGDLGMDSLMAVELRNILQASLGTPIAQTLFFDYPTVESLADYLAQELLADENQVVAQVAQTVKKPEAKEQDKRDHPPTPIPETEACQPKQEIPAQFYQFHLMPEYLNLQQDLARVEKMGNPFFEIHEGIARETTLIGGRELLNYSSYNYLGLSGEPVIAQAAKEAIDRYGTSVSASRLVSGEKPLHRDLEREIADFLETEDCIVYVGGHATNVTTISHLFGEKDLILHDALSHNSIQQGCTLSGATAIAFPHNDWQTLDRLLHQHRYQYEKVLIVIEGIYSTDGDLAPLPEIVEVKKRHQTFLMVDEAHSIGVLGASGRGISEYYGVSPAVVDIWMGTLSKSFASCGGYIAGCGELVRYLKYTAPGFIFSVGMSPANTAAALAAIRLLKTEPERVTRLRERAKLFLALAHSKGFNTGASNHSPIVPVIVGEPYKAVQLSRTLFKRGINVQPIVYPSVPYDAARLRFFITCLHTEEQIRLTVETLAQELLRN